MNVSKYFCNYSIYFLRHLIIINYNQLWLYLNMAHIYQPTTTPTFSSLFIFYCPFPTESCNYHIWLFRINSVNYLTATIFICFNYYYSCFSKCILLPFYFLCFTKYYRTRTECLCHWFVFAVGKPKRNVQQIISDIIIYL